MGRWLLPLLLLVALEASAGEEFNDKVATLEDFPREIPRGQKLDLTGSVRGAFRSPELILIAPNGKTYLNRDNDIGAYDFTFHVRFDEGVGPYRLEIIASKENSTKSAARFTVWHGARRPAEDVPEPPPPTGPKTPLEEHPRLIEKHFLERLNAFRKELRLPVVGWNEAVASRARQHAVRMAVAERRIHSFGKLGSVRSTLEDAGAAEGEHAGPSLPWFQLTTRRPFDKPAPQPPGPRVWNHVVTFVLAGESLDAMFETFFVREAAFRICAADPNCLEVGVGAARTPPPPPVTPKDGKTVAVPTRSPLVYYCVSFVQVNDEELIERQEKAYAALLKEARDPDPALLRCLGVWGRGGRAETLLRRALDDRNPEVGGAALDGLLLLDEERARGEAQDALVDARGDIARGRYDLAGTRLAPLRLVLFDLAIPTEANAIVREADRAAREELARIAKLPEPDRAAALRDLLGRVAGLPSAEEIRRRLG